MKMMEGAQREGASIVWRCLAAVCSVLLLNAGSATAAQGLESPTVVSVLVVKATWGPEPWGNQEVNDAIFRRAADFIETASFGHVRITGVQTDWLRAYRAAPRCNDDVFQAANTAALNAGFSVAQYQRVIYVLPALVGICGAGADIRTGQILLSGEMLPGLVEHELGHTFGLSHAGAVDCSRRSGCRRSSYGSPWDVMGSGYLGGNGQGDGDYGALQKACAGWLKNYEQVETPGVYGVDALEVASERSQALVIRAGAREYWIDHRDSVGNDRYLAGSNPFYRSVVTGIGVHEAQPDAVGLSELVRRPDYLLTNGRRGPLITPVGSTFKLSGVFALDVLEQTGKTILVRFRWIDHARPSKPQLVLPRNITKDKPFAITWKPARDSGSGIVRYLVRVDRQPRFSVAAGPDGKRVSAPLLPLGAGRHSIAVTAVDRAGNTSRAAVGSIKGK
jgi:hypothetical protein